MRKVDPNEPELYSLEDDYRGMHLYTVEIDVKIPVKLVVLGKNAEAALQWVEYQEPWKQWLHSTEWKMAQLGRPRIKRGVDPAALSGESPREYICWGDNYADFTVSAFRLSSARRGHPGE